MILHRRCLLPILTLVALTLLAAAQTAGPAVEGPPVQPIPFSHKTHAGTLDIECETCHPNPDPGEAMTIADPSVCMQCHATIKTDSPAIQKLAKASEEDRGIDWVRVYEIPSYVWFSHRTHLEAGNKCVECHGPVSERDRLAREGDISMAGCVNCHLAKGSSTDCSYCHEPLQ